MCVCMYVCMHVRISTHACNIFRDDKAPELDIFGVYACAHVCMCICTHGLHEPSYICIGICTYVYVYVHTCMRLGGFRSYIYVCVCVRIYICRYTCIYVCIDACIDRHIHAYRSFRSLEASRSWKVTRLAYTCAHTHVCRCIHSHGNRNRPNLVTFWIAKRWKVSYSDRKCMESTIWRRRKRVEWCGVYCVCVVTSCVYMHACMHACLYVCVYTICGSIYVSCVFVCMYS